MNVIKGIYNITGVVVWFATLTTMGHAHRALSKMINH